MSRREPSDLPLLDVMLWLGLGFVGFLGASMAVETTGGEGWAFALFAVPTAFFFLAALAARRLGRHGPTA